MNEPPPVLPTIEFKDRRGGLIGFGILVIFIGCICALFVPLMFVSQALSAKTTGGEPNYRIIIPGALTYTGIAIAYIWLGIGSILTRRWARALLLIVGWVWLLTGVLTMGVMAVVLPKIFANPPGGQPMQDAARIVMMIVMLGFLGVFMLAIPGALVLFYKSPHVKATCEVRDPVRRWTDACPLPVIALSLILGFGAVSMLTMPLSYHSVIPFFGRLVSGAAGTFLILAVAALWGWCAWATYRLTMAGWWIVLISYLVMMASAILTFAQVDLMDMYRQMGYPEEQIAQIQQYSFVTGRNLMWLMLFGAVPLVGYLLYVKKYFRLPTPGPAT